MKTSMMAFIIGENGGCMIPILDCVTNLEGASSNLQSILHGRCASKLGFINNRLRFSKLRKKCKLLKSKGASHDVSYFTAGSYTFNGVKYLIKRNQLMIAQYLKIQTCITSQVCPSKNERSQLPLGFRSQEIFLSVCYL